MFIGLLETNVSEILIEIYTFPSKKIRLQILSPNWWSFCLGRNVLIGVGMVKVGKHLYVNASTVQHICIEAHNPQQATVVEVGWFMSTCCVLIMTSLNENIFRVIGPMWGESTGLRWIPLTKANDAEIWCFLWSTPEQTVEQTVETPVNWKAIAIIMRLL